MPPAKSSKAGHDDAKAESNNAKDKSTNSSGTHTTGKARRGANAAGSHLKEVTNASSTSKAAAAAAAKEEAHAPGLNWNTFDRDVLHTYCREHRINTPPSFSSSYRHMILSRPGGIGRYSPTMARKREDRRQSKEKLALLVRKHFNGVGVQENDVIVDFIHKVKSQSISTADKMRRPPPPLDT